MAATVGDRIRARREQLGLSQARLVQGMPLSSTYVSLIETGQRQPRDRVLELLAKRLDCSVEYLTTGRGGANESDMLLELRFAELALQSGDPRAARDRFQQTLDQAARLHYDDVRLQALWGRSRAEEALGRLEDAIAGFLALAAEDHLPAEVSRTILMMHLARAYGQCGELDRAVEVGETAIAETRRADADLLDVDEVTSLASTLVGCYYLRGNLTQAFVLIKQVIEDAERYGSPRSRAAAYWNAGLVAEGRGDIESALRYTERALALYSELNSARSTLSLRINYATLLLRAPDPDPVTAEALLRHSLEQMPGVGSPVELTIAETELARCLLLSGQPAEAARLVTAAMDRLAPEVRLETTRARVLLGKARLALGDTEAAMTTFTIVAEELARLDANRHVAEVWSELGDAMSAVGLHERAAQAYRQGIRAAGIPAPLSADRYVAAVAD